MMQEDLFFQVEFGVIPTITSFLLLVEMLMLTQDLVEMGIFLLDLLGILLHSFDPHSQV
jgi:hypothetical protein